MKNHLAGAPLYSDSHAAISRILGRTYNNPLGESSFPILNRLVAGVPFLRVLDAGCGRGHTARWWAANRERGRVDAFDPAPAMLEEARAQAVASGLEDRVRLQQADLSSFRLDEPYHLALVLDVLCYSGSRFDDMERLLAYGAQGAVVSITDYHGLAEHEETRRVVEAWQVGPPVEWSRYREGVEASARRAGARVLLMVDTTRQYKEHWEGMGRRLRRHRDDLVGAVGEEQVAVYANKIDANLRAVAAGSFGHLWTILEKSGS